MSHTPNVNQVLKALFEALQSSTPHSDGQHAKKRSAILYYKQYLQYNKPKKTPYLTGDQAQGFWVGFCSEADEEVKKRPENRRAGYFAQHGGYTCFDNREGKFVYLSFSNEPTCIAYLNGELI